MTFPVITPELARRFEDFEADNLLEYVSAARRIRPELGAVGERLGGGVVVALGPGLFVNKISSLGLSGPAVDEDLERAEAVLLERGLDVRIEVCPLADLGLLELLERRGYRARYFLDMLYRPLAPGDAELEPPGGVTVRPLEPGEDEAFVEALVDGWAGPPEERERQRLLARLALERPGASGFLAFLGGEVAGAGTVKVSGGTAMLQSAGTLPASRGRGVQAALIAARLRAAAEAGAALALVQASPGGVSHRNLERAGFRVAYTKLGLKLALPGL